MRRFEGGLADQLTAFVAYKRSLGFAYDTEEAMLQRFDRWTLGIPGQHVELTPELVDGWLVPGPMEGNRTRTGRISLMRQLAIYLNSMGHHAYIPESSQIAHPFRFVPHIFTPKELDAIFQAADQLPPNRWTALPTVLPVILRLLYGCGLRVSEATKLTVQDLCWRDRTVAIKNSKFGKDRVVPMSDSAATICQSYAQAVHAASPPTTYFFCHRDGRAISPNTIYKRFRIILWQAGIAHGGPGVGPRVHDLRHSFAVHALKAAVDRQVDVYAALPLLSAYLGHASVLATEHYVRLTADAFPEIRRALDHTTGWVIPGVEES